MAVEALLFDLGGVVIEIDFDRAFARWARSAGERVDTIRSRFSFDAFYERHERGEIGVTEYFASLRTSLGIDLSDDEFAQGWEAIYIREVHGIVDLLRSVGKRVPLYAFTNSNAAHTAVWARDYASALASFRKVFISFEMGLRKPEPAAFEAIAKEIRVSLGRILFFDDTRDNVIGAMAIGMPAIQVRSIQDIENAIARFGV